MIRYQDYIDISPDMRFGQPRIINTRITVYDVLSWLANGMSISQIIHDFPELKEDHVKACLAYAADKEHKLRVA